MSEKTEGWRGEQVRPEPTTIKNLFVSDGSQFTSGAACNPDPDDRFRSRSGRRITSRGANAEKRISEAGLRIRRLRPEEQGRGRFIQPGSFSLPWQLFGGIEDRRGRALGRPERQRHSSSDRSGMKQRSSEAKIPDLAMVIEHLVVQRGQKTSRGSCPPWRRFPPACPQNEISSRIDVQWPPIRSDRVVRFVIALRLVRETNGTWRPSGRITIFPNDITRLRDVTIPPARAAPKPDRTSMSSTR